ncbi:MAG TPA: hypothetical protein VNG53_08695 [Bacteroidia bacterium]|nr:hypothetical protein [Bacteroidia bacterium]
MTKEEVSKFAMEITYISNRTTITFKNSTKVVGYFENNTPNDDLYNQNKWNFVCTQQNNNEKKQTTFDGNTFHSIQIIDIRQHID